MYESSTSVRFCGRTEILELLVVVGESGVVKSFKGLFKTPEEDCIKVHSQSKCWFYLSTWLDQMQYKNIRFWNKRALV